MRMRLRFWCWLLFGEPVNVRIFFRSGLFDNDNLQLRYPTAKVAWSRCSKMEQDYIVWCNPIFKEFE